MKNARNFTNSKPRASSDCHSCCSDIEEVAADFTASITWMACWVSRGDREIPSGEDRSWLTVKGSRIAGTVELDTVGCGRGRGWEEADGVRWLGGGGARSEVLGMKMVSGRAAPPVSGMTLSMARRRAVTLARSCMVGGVKSRSNWNVNCPFRFRWGMRIFWALYILKTKASDQIFLKNEMSTHVMEKLNFEKKDKRKLIEQTKMESEHVTWKHWSEFLL